MSRILVILGHPNSSSWNGALAEKYVEGAKEAGADIRYLKLGELDFDPVLRMGFQGEQPLETDLENAKSLIEWSQHIVFVFPTWWVGMPALLKGFIDRVFLPGWAFAYTKESPLPAKLLKGRTARVLTTMDSPNWWYRLLHRRAVHRALVQGTLHFVGISPVKETTIFADRELSPKAREKWLNQVKTLAQKDTRKLQKKAQSTQTIPAHTS